MTSNRDSQSIHKDITKRCWITDDFSEDIRRFYPTRDEIRVNSTLGDCVRDLNAFKRKCAILFPVGRVFLSKIQFDQAAKHFLDGWNCKKVHHGKKIRCFFQSVLTNHLTSPHVIRRSVGQLHLQLRNSMNVPLNWDIAILIWRETWSYLYLFTK